jgi:hypothetical protein
MTNEYSLIRTFGGLALEYADIAEAVFAAAAGAAYTPPERGDFRRIDGTRRVQLLMECPGVVETFQTSAATVRLPANDVSFTTNDAGDGRLFFLKNSGTGYIYVESYTGTSLITVDPNTIIVALGNTANTWDFINPAASTTLVAGVNIAISGTNPYTIYAFDLTTTITSASTLTLINTDTAQQRFTGVTAGQNLDLPDATSLDVGKIYIVWNDSSVDVNVRNSTSASLFILPAGYRGIVTLVDDGSAAGSWTWMMMTESDRVKSGVVSAGSFSGSPKVAAISFANAFASSAYAVTITGVDKRSWSYTSKSSSGFTLEANANASLTAEVSWHAIRTGD